MNTSYKENTPDNFWQIRWLDRYMEGHNGGSLQAGVLKTSFPVNV